MTVVTLSLENGEVTVNLPGMSACDCPSELGCIRTTHKLEHGQFVAIPRVGRMLRVEMALGDEYIVSQWRVTDVRPL